MPPALPGIFGITHGFCSAVRLASDVLMARACDKSLRLSVLGRVSVDQLC